MKANWAARICSVLALLFEIHDPCFEKLEEEKQSYHDAYHVEEDIGDGGVTARNVFLVNSSRMSTTKAVKPAIKRRGFVSIVSLGPRLVKSVCP